MTSSILVHWISCTSHQLPRCGQTLNPCLEATSQPGKQPWTISLHINQHPGAFQSSYTMSVELKRWNYAHAAPLVRVSWHDLVWGVCEGMRTALPPSTMERRTPTSLTGSMDVLHELFCSWLIHVMSHFCLGSTGNKHGLLKTNDWKVNIHLARIKKKPINESHTNQRWCQNLGISTF